jgi:hypothetical protein
MEEKRWKEKTFKWLGGHGISMTKEFLSSVYNDPVVESGADPRTSPTGLLVLFRIEPKPGRSDLPSFSVRWDQGANTVDIDLIGDPQEKQNFALPIPGYHGHKTTIITDSPRVYAIQIETPATGPIFIGTVALNIAFGLELSGSLSMSADLEVTPEVIRNGKPTTGWHSYRSWLAVAALFAAISGLALTFFALRHRDKKL